MAAPATPTGLAVDQVWSTAVKLSWNSSAGADTYNVYKSTDNVTYALEQSITDVDYIDQFAEESTQYYYKVSAENVDGESALSASVNDTTLASSLKKLWIAGGKSYHEYDENSYSEFAPTAVEKPALHVTGIIRALTTPSNSYDVLRLTDIGSIGAPAGASYVVIGLSGILTSERKLTAGDILSLVDGGANGNVTLNVDYKDEDDMASDSAVHVPTQQSVKAYVDGKYPPEAHIVDADGSLADITSKFNTLLASLENLGFLSTS